ncbi:MAG: hypothetical protein K2J83_05435 [Clostridia bacterium]|nr:hypothetical protein [Clostridia bacterium]
MNESKRNKLVAAITVNVVILIAVLVAVVIYQIVDICVLTGRRNKLQAEIDDIQQKIESTQDTLEYYKSESYLLDKAFEFGYVFGDD